jgi:hypothetical protein
MPSEVSQEIQLKNTPKNINFTNRKDYARPDRRTKKQHYPLNQLLGKLPFSGKRG